MKFSRVSVSFLFKDTFKVIHSALQKKRYIQSLEELLDNLKSTTTTPSSLGLKSQVTFCDSTSFPHYQSTSIWFIKLLHRTRVRSSDGRSCCNGGARLENRLKVEGWYLWGGQFNAVVCGLDCLYLWYSTGKKYRISFVIQLNFSFPHQVGGRRRLWENHLFLPNRALDNNSVINQPAS